MSFERELGAGEAIERIARMTKAFADRADVGEMEIAGSIVSYLAAHSEVIPDLMKGFWSVSRLPEGWQADGRLNWRRAFEEFPSPSNQKSSRADTHTTSGRGQYLKPCPFCGKSNQVKTAVDRAGWIGTVECLACSAAVHGESNTDFDSAIQSECDVWNRRTA